MWNLLDSWKLSIPTPFLYRPPKPSSQTPNSRTLFSKPTTFFLPDQQLMWRWTGFAMGVDLIATFDNLSLSIKRNHHTSSANEHEALLSNHRFRNVFYKVSVVSLNEQKQVRKKNYFLEHAIALFDSAGWLKSGIFWREKLSSSLWKGLWRVPICS